MPSRSSTPKPPPHLKPATAGWWRDVIREYVLEAPHVRILTLLADGVSTAASRRARSWTARG